MRTVLYIFTIGELFHRVTVTTTITQDTEWSGDNWRTTDELSSAYHLRGTTSPGNSDNRELCNHEYVANSLKYAAMVSLIR